MNEKGEFICHEFKTFHVVLKNGHTFDFTGSPVPVRLLVDNHLLITSNGIFLAAFDISEISIAVTMRMYRYDGRLYESIDELMGNVGNDETECR